MFEFLQHLANWFSTGIYDFVVEAMGYFISSAILGWFKLQLVLLEFAWDIGKSILQGLGLNTLLQSAWNALPPDVLGELQFFKIPESVNLLLTGVCTRLAMNFIPGV